MNCAGWSRGDSWSCTRPVACASHNQQLSDGRYRKLDQLWVRWRCAQRLVHRERRALLHWSLHSSPARSAFCHSPRSQTQMRPSVRTFELQRDPRTRMGFTCHPIRNYLRYFKIKIQIHSILYLFDGSVMYKTYSNSNHFPNTILSTK